MNRRDLLLATLSAAALTPALRALAAQAVATPSVTSVDPAKYPRAWKVQRSTIVVNGLEGSAMTDKYLEMLKAGGVHCVHQSVGGLDSFASVLTFLDQHPDKIVQAGTVSTRRLPPPNGGAAAAGAAPRPRAARSHVATECPCHDGSPGVPGTNCSTRVCVP